MLTIVSVNPTGLGPYGMHEDVQLEGRGVVWLTGENLDKGGSNGAGKTWFFNTIAQCLFGRIESYSGGTVAANDEVSNEVLGRGSCPRVEFIAGTNDKWRVTCSRSWRVTCSRSRTSRSLASSGRSKTNLAEVVCQDEKGILSPYLKDSELYPFKGSDVYLERFDGFDWIDERCSTMALTKQKLREIVGMSYERYLATTYLAQGKGLDFLRGSHAQKMAIFSDTVDLAIWDRAAEQFKLKRDETRAAVQKVFERLCTLRGRLEGLNSISAEAYDLKLSEASQLTQQIVEAEQAEKQLHACVASHSAKVEELLRSVDRNPYVGMLADIDRARRAEVATFDESIGAEQMAKTELRLECEAAAGKLDLKRAELDRGRCFADQTCNAALRSIQSCLAPEAADLRAAIASNAVSLARLERTLKDLRDGKLSVCPTCGQAVDPGVNESHISTEMVQIRTSTDVLSLELQEILARLEAKKEEESAEAHKDLGAKMNAFTKEEHAIAIEIEGLAKSKALKDAEFDKRVKHLDNQLAKVLDVYQRKEEAARSLFDAFELEVASVRKTAEETAKMRDEAQSKIAGVRKALNEMAVVLGRLKMEIDRYEVTAQDRKSLESAIELVLAEQVVANLDEAEWSWLVKNVGDKGIKSFKIEQACLRLNELLSESLADLDGSFQVWCQPYRPRTGVGNRKEADLTSEDLVQDFTIYVRDGEKKEVPLYLYSGGESSLLAFAFLVAFWRLSDEHGSGTNLLLLDEVVSALDQRNSQIVVKFLESLKSSGKTVIAVSHSQVVDSVDFDATWTCRKQGGVSQLLCV